LSPQASEPKDLALVRNLERTPGTGTRQGDIYSDVEHVYSVRQAEGYVEIKKILFPLAIVLSQQCDLDNSEFLVSVLVAPLYNLQHVLAGVQLEDLKLPKAQPISLDKTPGKYLVSNQRPRYHYLMFPKEVHVVPSVIDFRHFFTVSREYLDDIRPTKFVCQVSTLYREDISQRFAAFLSRIGLPDPPKTKAL